jgi:hypothetical protein
MVMRNHVKYSPILFIFPILLLATVSALTLAASNGDGVSAQPRETRGPGALTTGANWARASPASGAVCLSVPIGCGKITLTSPNGGESWGAGTRQTITWIFSGTDVPVMIELSRDGGSTWTTINYGTKGGSQVWRVTGEATNEARIKVRSLGVPATFDISDENFTIGQPITVTSPHGDENTGVNWAVGTSQKITWDSLDVTGNIKIQLSRNGGSSWGTIIAATPNDGSELWKVTGPPTTQTRIRVISIIAGAVFGNSEANFTITRP